jgi:hypothetical protein
MVDDNPKSHLAELAEPPKVQKESWVLVDSRRTKNGLKSKNDFAQRQHRDYSGVGNVLQTKQP